VRGLPDGQNYARVSNFVMPWYGIITAPEPKGPSTVFFSVPIDDTHHRAWFVNFNLYAPLGLTQLSVTPDPMDFPPVPKGDKSNAWGQNRGVMKRGHFSGFPQHFATEDFAIFLSQGPRLDRSNEQLCSSDMAIVKLRAMILADVKARMAGETPPIGGNGALDYSSILSFGGVYGPDKTWRALREDGTLMEGAAE
jgi:phthalate 4,5-dioxygenase oxygenase subunit